MAEHDPHEPVRPHEPHDRQDAHRMGGAHPAAHFTAVFVDEVGVRITYYGWTVTRPKAVVQISHGVGEHGARYASLAADLNEAGYSVYAADQRGHGATGLAQHGGDRSKLGRLGPGGLRATVDDIRQLGVRIAREHPGVPLVLLGHSWGSLMVQKLVNSPALTHYAGIVLSGTAYRMPGSMDGGDLTRKHRPVAVPGQSPIAGNGFEWLSRDVAAQERAAGDELMFPAEVLKLFGLPDALRLFGRPAKRLDADVPLLILVGSDDTLGGRRSAEKLRDAYRTRSKLTDVTLTVYDDARHEIFNETNRLEVVADLVAWLDSRVAVAPASADSPTAPGAPGAPA
ncbi:lysophospholipase [Herbiconiux sp. CPCC 203407]|uniref:Lysophospholipase n=1 Tax=Herbiconiux oxytropis TaxID=2970915 RepID=A0AA41XEJ8_9MICO|nr:lysophospholipase [Herbiconiux oxytropis]MCS5720680.1 lysophospholipase [Herbiconiux oxytropis]MCS5724993.1 lysophospholipase [Herbiconiux oxytropis]